MACGGAVAPLVTLNPSNSASPSEPLAWEVRNIPASWVPAWPGTLALPTVSQLPTGSLSDFYAARQIASIYPAFPNSFKQKFP